MKEAKILSILAGGFFPRIHTSMCIIFYRRKGEETLHNLTTGQPPNHGYNKWLTISIPPNPPIQVVEKSLHVPFEDLYRSPSLPFLPYPMQEYPLRGVFVIEDYSIVVLPQLSNRKTHDGEQGCPTKALPSQNFGCPWFGQHKNNLANTKMN
jgi:hypothetical protein